MKLYFFIILNLPTFLNPLNISGVSMQNNVREEGIFNTLKYKSPDPAIPFGMSINI